MFPLNPQKSRRKKTVSRKCASNFLNFLTSGYACRTVRDSLAAQPSLHMLASAATRWYSLHSRAKHNKFDEIQETTDHKAKRKQCCQANEDPSSAWLLDGAHFSPRW